MISWMGNLEKQNSIDYNKAFAIVVRTGFSMFDVDVVYKEDFDKVNKNNVIEAWY